jgi:hypothetical protein
MRFKKCKTCLIAAAMITLAFCCTARAEEIPPTQYDAVLKSINQNTRSTTDMSKVVPWLIGGVALIIMLALYSQRRQRTVSPRALNHRGKLVREIAKGIHLRKVEVKQLKMLADEKELSSPLTLLICPSVLVKAMRSRNPRLDRRVLAQLAQRMARQSEAKVEE